MLETWTDFTALFHDPWIVHVAFAGLIVYPLWRVFVRAGVQPLWSLLVAVPLVGFTAALLILARTRWTSTPPLQRVRRS